MSELSVISNRGGVAIREAAAGDTRSVAQEPGAASCVLGRRGKRERLGVGEPDGVALTVVMIDTSDGTITYEYSYFNKNVRGWRK